MDQPLTEDRPAIVYLYMIAPVAAVGGFLFGYDLSLMSGAVIFLETEFALTPFWYGVVAGSAILGCPFGPLAGVLSYPSDSIYGKKTDDGGGRVVVDADRHRWDGAKQFFHLGSGVEIGPTFGPAVSGDACVSLG